MKKIFILLTVLVSCISLNAQTVDGSVPDSTTVSKVEETIINLPLSELKKYSDMEKLGQSEFLIGSISAVAGAALAVTPLVYNTVTGTKMDSGTFYYMTGAAFLGFGIIYTAVGLSTWCKGTKHFKNLTIQYSPFEFAINF